MQQGVAQQQILTSAANAKADAKAAEAEAEAEEEEDEIVLKFSAPTPAPGPVAPAPVANPFNPFGGAFGGGPAAKPKAAAFNPFVRIHYILFYIRCWSL